MADAERRLASGVIELGDRGRRRSLAEQRETPVASQDEIGLGRVVYSHQDGPPGTNEGRPASAKSDGEPEHPDEHVEEASEESFPASDPPGYAVGKSSPTTEQP